MLESLSAALAAAVSAMSGKAGLALGTNPASSQASEESDSSDDEESDVEDEDHAAGSSYRDGRNARTHRVDPEDEAGGDGGDPGDGEYGALPILTRAHVKAIEEGHFLYDPSLVQSVIDIGQRLANIDHYIDADDPERKLSYRMTQVLTGDLEDFMQLVSMMTTRFEFLRENHEDAHIEIMEAYKLERAQGKLPPSPGGWGKLFIRQIRYLGRSLALGIQLTCCPERTYKNLRGAPVPRRFELPHAIEKAHRAEIYTAAYEAFLELSNIGSDVLFIATQLYDLKDTAWAPFFHVAVSALVATFAGRIMIPLVHAHMVDWRDERRVQKFFAGLIIGIVEPISGFNGYIRHSFKVQETTGSEVAGDFARSSKDQIATQAKTDYGVARMAIFTTIVLLVQDIPLIIVQSLYISQFQGGNFEFVYWLALATSLLSAVRQIAESYYLINEIPNLRNLMFVRHVVLAPDRRLDDGDPDAGNDQNADDASPEDRPSARQALFRFFQSDPQDANVKLRHHMTDALFTLFTSGLSLLWRSDYKRSWAAFRHFTKTLQPSLILEGTPLQMAKLNNAGRDDDINTLRGCGSLAPVWCTRKNRSELRTRDTSGLTSWSLLFNRMNSETLRGSIRTLELTNCFSVDDANLALIAEHCPMLSKLDLRFCVEITDGGLEHFRRRKCIALSSVTLDACVKVTSKGAGFVAKAATTSLRRLSLRSLPDLDEEVFTYLAACPNLRSLILDVDLLYKELPGREGSFLSIGKESGPFKDFLKKCGPSLQDLRLNNAIGSFEQFEKLGKRLNRFTRTLGIAGARIDAAGLASLTKRAPFLREINLTHAPRLIGIKEVCMTLNSIQTINICGNEVPKEDVDALYDAKTTDEGKLLDLKVVVTDSLDQLMKHYKHQLGLQLRKYAIRYGKWVRANEELEMAASHETRICIPALACAAQEMGPSEEVKDAIAAIDAKVREIDALQKSGGLPTFGRGARVSENAVAIFKVSSIVGLLDFVRRARERLELPAVELRKWLKLVRHREVEKARSALEAAEATEDTIRDIIEAKIVPQPARVPFVSLPSFGVISTRNVNISIDFKTKTYVFNCPDELKAAYRPATEAQMRFAGTMSPLGNVTLNRSGGATKDLLHRYWAIPPDARYYCWAYPAKGLTKDSELDYLGHQRHEDAGRRFLHFGGFLYFDADHHFLGLSSLTFGTVLSFNGPFELEQATMRNLEGRWNPVTIKSLIPKDATTAEFCYIFKHEKVLPAKLREHVQHGCFAYRFKADDDTRFRGFVYSIAQVRNAILKDEDVLD